MTAGRTPETILEPTAGLRLIGAAPVDSDLIVRRHGLARRSGPGLRGILQKSGAGWKDEQLELIDSDFKFPNPISLSGMHVQLRVGLV